MIALPVIALWCLGAAFICLLYMAGLPWFILLLISVAFVCIASFITLAAVE